MILLMLLTLTLGVLVILAAWRAVRDILARRAGEEPPPSAEQLPLGAESLEGVLAAQLNDGEITRSQYRRAMSQIAAREEQRRPMSVPMDD